MEYDCASDRIAKLVIQVSRRHKIQIVCAPTISYTSEEVEDYYEEITSMNQKRKCYVKFIIAEYSNYLFVIFHIFIVY